jgi:hypothetical protein
MMMNLALTFIQNKERTKERLEMLPSEAAEVVRKCITYSPGERMQTAEELREACIKLDALLEKEEKEAIERGEQPPILEKKPKSASQTTPASQTAPASQPTPASQTALFGSGALTTRSPAFSKSAETIPDTPEVFTAATKKEKSRRKRQLLIGVCIASVCGLGVFAITIMSPDRSGKTTPKKQEQAKTHKVKAAKPRPAPQKPALSKPPSKGQRPSDAYITRIYKAVDAKCMRTDPRRAAFDRFPHYRLSCIRWYTQKLCNRNQKNFDKVALVVLVLDEARAHYCFYKRQNVCGKGKRKRFLAKRRGLINECKRVTHKIGARRRKKGSKLKRLTFLMSGSQTKKIRIWVASRQARRKQIRATWIKSQPPDRMLCFKKRR